MQNAVVPPRQRRWSAALVVALAVAVPACDSGPQTAATVVLDAPTNTLLVGQSVQITPTVKDGSGKILVNRPIIYQSSAPTIAAVSSTGQVVALAPGSATVSATVDAATGSLSIIVSPVPVSRIAMSRDTATLKAATTLQLTATAQDSAGHTLGDRTLTWSSSDATIATVNGNGLVSALAPGSATISATTEGKTGTTRLTVTPAAIATIDVAPSISIIPEGSTKQLTATVKDAAGRVLTGRTLTWTSSDVTSVTVSSSGLVTAVAPGIANILVTADNTVGGASVQVTPVVIGSVVISPDTATLVIGGTIQLSATVKDSTGNVITFKPVSWSSQDTSIATVDGTGKVTAVATGSVGIVAQRDGKADTATIRVTPTPVGSITLSPAPAHLGVGRSGRLAITLRDAAGNLLIGRHIDYLSGNTAIVTVDTSGLLVGLAPGTTSLTISSGGSIASTLVIVETTTVASLTLDPTVMVFSAPGGSQTLSVVPKDATDTVLAGRTMAFSSSDTTVATVSNTGRVTAVASGQAVITVVSEGISAQLDVTVQ